MIVQILQFLLEVVSGLIAGACLLRLYMQAQRIPFNNPVGQLVFALSDWIERGAGTYVIGAMMLALAWWVARGA